MDVDVISAPDNDAAPRKLVRMQEAVRHCLLVRDPSARPLDHKATNLKPVHIHATDASRTVELNLWEVAGQIGEQNVVQVAKADSRAVINLTKPEIGIVVGPICHVDGGAVCRDPSGHLEGSESGQGSNSVHRVRPAD